VISALHQVTVVDGSLLDLACGLEAVIRRFDGLLDRYAPQGGSAANHTDLPITEFLLGLIAIRHRLADVLARAAVAEQPPAEQSIQGDSWLR
jgi:hypothetical protein